MALSGASRDEETCAASMRSMSVTVSSHSRFWWINDELENKIV